jgi:hypothetical protein
MTEKAQDRSGLVQRLMGFEARPAVPPPGAKSATGKLACRSTGKAASPTRRGSTRPACARSSRRTGGQAAGSGGRGLQPAVREVPQARDRGLTVGMLRAGSPFIALSS